MYSSVQWGFGSGISGALGGGNTQGVNVPTGALIKNTPVSIAHGLLACTAFTLSVSNATNYPDVNKLYPDPALPTTHFIIEVSVDLPAGLLVHVLGYPNSAATPLTTVPFRTGTTTGAAINAALGILTIVGGFVPSITRPLCFTWLDEATGISVNLPATIDVALQTITVNIGAVLPPANVYRWDLIYL